MRKSGKYTFGTANSWKEYEGEFSDKVQLEGKGKLTYSDDKIYTGNFIANKREDNEASITFPSGDKILGKFANETLFVGSGKMTFTNGDFYEGGFSQNYLPHDKGRMTFQSDPVWGEYSGKLVDGKIDDDAAYLILKNGDFFLAKSTIKL